MEMQRESVGWAGEASHLRLRMERRFSTSWREAARVEGGFQRKHFYFVVKVVAVVYLNPFHICFCLFVFNHSSQG